MFSLLVDIVPRDSETLFKRFYDLHLINMSSGGQGRRRNVGDIRAFLKWAVEEKDSPDRWFPIIINNEIIVGVA